MGVGVDAGGVAKLDARGRDGNRDVDRGAVVVDHQVEVAERRVIGVVVQGRVRPQAVEQGFHLGQERDQRPVRVAPGAGRAVGLHALGFAGEQDVAAVAAHRAEPGRLHHQYALQFQTAGQRRPLGDHPGTQLGGFFIGCDQQGYGDAGRQAGGGEDGSGHRPFHVGAAEAVQHPFRVDTAGPGVILPPGVGHGVHMPGKADAAGAAAVGDQNALRHTGVVVEIDAFDVEAT